MKFIRLPIVMWLPDSVESITITVYADVLKRIFIVCLCGFVTVILEAGVCQRTCMRVTHVKCNLKSSNRFTMNHCARVQAVRVACVACFNLPLLCSREVVGTLPVTRVVHRHRRLRRHQQPNQVLGIVMEGQLRRIAHQLHLQAVRL